MKKIIIPLLLILTLLLSTSLVSATFLNRDTYIDLGGDDFLYGSGINGTLKSTQNQAYSYSYLGNKDGGGTMYQSGNYFVTLGNSCNNKSYVISGESGNYKLLAYDNNGSKSYLTNYDTLGTLTFSNIYDVQADCDNNKIYYLTGYDIYEANLTSPEDVSRIKSFNQIMRGMEFLNNTWFFVSTSNDFLTFYSIDHTLNNILATQNFSLSSGLPLRNGLSYYDNHLYIVTDYSHDYLYGYNITNNNIYDISKNYNTYYLWGDYYTQNICLNDNSYCKNISIISLSTGNEPFCSLNDTIYCSGGCTNVKNSNDLLEGECTQLSCTNECNIKNIDTCTSSNTYAKCGQYDQDACLEYGSILQCPANQYCIEDNLGAYCSNVTEGQYYNQESINVNLELKSNTGTVDATGTSKTLWGSGFLYKTGSFLNHLISKKTVSVSTALSNENVTYVTQTYDATGTNSQNYYAYNCDYKENIIYQDNLQSLSNSWNTNNNIVIDNYGYSYLNITNNATLNFNESKNSMIELLLLPNTNITSDYYIYVKNNNEVLNKIKISYNTSNNEIIISDVNNNKVITDVTSANNDIESIYLNLAYMENIKSMYMKISIERKILGQIINEYYYSLPLSISDNLQANNILFEGNNNGIKLYQVNIVSVNNYPIFKQNNNDKKELSCSFSEPKCYNVRVYGNSQGMPTYHFYDDIKTCVTTVGGLQIIPPNIVNFDSRSMIEKALNLNLDSKQKLMYSSLFLVFLFMIFIVASLMQNTNLPIIFGAVITGLSLVVFAVDGWIPLWIIVLFGVIGAFIGVGIMKGGLLGKGD